MEATAPPGSSARATAQEGFLGSIGVRFMIDGAEAGRGSRSSSTRCPRGRSPRRCTGTRARTIQLRAPGRMGALLGDDVVEAGPGDLVFKPRDQWHTFWNAGDEPARILEIISPAGFEQFFHELDALGGALKADPEALAAAQRALRPGDGAGALPELLERFGLQIGEQLAGGWTPPFADARAIT